MFSIIARYFWEKFDAIDAMEINSIDALCAKADACAMIERKFKMLPKFIQIGIANIKRNEVL